VFDGLLFLILNRDLLNLAFFSGLLSDVICKFLTLDRDRDLVLLVSDSLGGVAVVVDFDRLTFLLLFLTLVRLRDICLVGLGVTMSSGFLCLALDLDRLRCASLGILTNVGGYTSDEVLSNVTGTTFVGFNVTADSSA
jgi:hypothetical protein